MSIKVDKVKLSLRNSRAIARIHNSAFSEWINNKELGKAYGYKRLSSKDVMNWLGDVWVAYENNTPVGCVHCNLIEEKGVKILDFYRNTNEGFGQSEIAVSSKRKGVATELLNIIIDYYKIRDAEFVVVLTYNDNSAANAFLEHYGFVHKEKYYYDKYSTDSDEPLAHDTILAMLDLSKEIKKFDLNKELEIVELTKLLRRKLFSERLRELKELFRKSAWWVYGKDVIPSDEQIRKWLIDKPQEFTLVGYLNGKLVGIMEFNGETVGIPGVLPKYRGKGVGKTLFYHLLNRMKQMNRKSAFGDTGVILSEMIKLYEFFGFDTRRKVIDWVLKLK